MQIFLKFTNVLQIFYVWSEDVHVFLFFFLSFFFFFLGGGGERGGSLIYKILRLFIFLTIF